VSNTVDLVVLDPLTSDGWVSKRKFANDITMTRSGGEQRVQRWPFSRKEYEIPYEYMEMDQFLALAQFFELRGGSARPFLLWDATPDVYADTQVIGTGDGSNKVFQLSVTYTDAANSVTRPILHPVMNGVDIPDNLLGLVPGPTTTSFTVKDNTTLKTYGTDYTIDERTGLLTFGTAPTSGHTITASFWYYTVVRFTGDEFTMNLESTTAKANPNLIEVLYEN